MTPTTYSTLSTNIQSYIIESTSTAFLASIQTFINNAETRIVRELDTNNLVKTLSSTFTTSSPLYTRPTDLLFVKAFSFYPTAATRVNLLERTLPYIKDYWQNPNDVSSIPKYYAWTDTYFYIAPTPAFTYVTELVYVYQPTALSISNQNNVLSNYYSDLLLYASLIEASLFIQDDASISRFERLYQDRLQKANSIGRRETQDDMQTYNMSLPANTTTNNSRRS